MSNRKPKKKLRGVWRSLYVVIWLVGIYILFQRGQFFPGILILVAISLLYEGFLQRFAPDAFYEQPTPQEKPMLQPEAPIPAAPVASPAPAEMHRIDLLPQVCPNCNGPIRGNEARWTGPRSANCPYCGTNLPMKQA